MELTKYVYFQTLPKSSSGSADTDFYYSILAKCWATRTKNGKTAESK